MTNPRSRSGTKARFAVAGMGFTAMLALVGNMEVNASRARAAAAAAPPAPPRPLVIVHPEVAPSSIAARSGVTRRPIVLTAHAVVHVVKVAGSGASGGGSGGYATYSGGGSSSGSSVSVAAPAPAPAPAAPAATTSGSHP
jgi:uncharacterized membrane protein YgcG